MKGKLLKEVLRGHNMAKDDREKGIVNPTNQKWDLFLIPKINPGQYVVKC